MRTIGGRWLVAGGATVRPVAEKKRKFNVLLQFPLSTYKLNLHVPRPRFLSGGDLDLGFSLL